MDDIAEDAAIPDHLPELLLRIEDRKLVFIFMVLCIAIQMAQLYIVTKIADVSVSYTLVKTWRSDGLVTYWGKCSDTFKKEIDIIEELKNGNLVLTDAGRKSSQINMMIGVALLFISHFHQLNAVIFTNDYHVDGRDHFVIKASWVVTLGQVIVGSFVVFACAQNVIVNSVDSAETLENSLYAFFILEIDDQLLALMWVLVPGQKKGE